MNRVSYRVSHRLTRQPIGCDSKKQPPLRGRAAAVLEPRQHLHQRAQVMASQVVVPKRPIVAVDDRVSAIAYPINDASQASPVSVPSPVDSASSTSPKLVFFERFSQLWIGWLMMALLLSAWIIFKIVMV